jgi:hypothetical protein
MRGKGFEYVIADSAFKHMQIDTRLCRLDAGEHHRAALHLGQAGR